MQVAVPKVAVSTSPGVLPATPEAAGGSRKLSEGASDGSPCRAPALASSSLSSPGGSNGGRNRPVNAAGRGGQEGSGAVSGAEEPKRAPSAAGGRGREGSAPAGRPKGSGGVGVGGGPLRKPCSAGWSSEGFAPARRLPKGSGGPSAGWGLQLAPSAAGGDTEMLPPAEGLAPAGCHPGWSEVVSEGVSGVLPADITGSYSKPREATGADISSRHGPILAPMLPSSSISAPSTSRRTVQGPISSAPAPFIQLPVGYEGFSGAAGSGGASAGAPGQRQPRKLPVVAAAEAGGNNPLATGAGGGRTERTADAHPVRDGVHGTPAGVGSGVIWGGTGGVSADPQPKKLPGKVASEAHRVPPPGPPSGAGGPGGAGGYALGTPPGVGQNPPVSGDQAVVGLGVPSVAPGGGAAEAQGVAPASWGGPSSAASDPGPSEAVRDQFTCPITQVW